MGKNWRGNKGGNGNSSSGSNLSSCRGYGVILGTCDSARERETSKELVNLFTQVIEEQEEQNKDSITTNNNDTYNNINNIVCKNDNNESSVSIQASLEQELAEIRQGASKKTQQVISIKTSVKGVVVIKVMNKRYNPVDLVLYVFEKVQKEKLPCTRYVVRLIPLETVFYPQLDELTENVRIMGGRLGPLKPIVSEIAKDCNSDTVGKKRKLDDTLIDTNANADIDEITDSVTTATGATTSITTADCNVDADADAAASKGDLVSVPTEESVTKVEIDEAENANELTKTEATAFSVEQNSRERSGTSTIENFSSSYKNIRYTVSFKARNNNVLSKNQVLAVARLHMPTNAYNDQRSEEVTVPSFIVTLLLHCRLSHMLYLS